MLAASRSVRSLARRGSSDGARPYRATILDRRPPEPSEIRFSAVPARTRTRADLAAPPRTQASKRNIARPAVSDPSMVSVSAPKVPRRPTTRAGSGRIERFSAHTRPRRANPENQGLSRGKTARPRPRLRRLPRPSPTDH